jgi:hypothetical protein
MPLPPLQIPAELELDLSDPHTIDLRYPGDVTLGQTFGRQLGSVWAGGDLTLEVPNVTGTCVAQGVLRISGDVDATRLTGRELHLTGNSIRARALSATERIVIGAARLKVDVIIAPVIEIHSKASGRVTVIESLNDRSPTKIKGGFTLTEYDELFGDAVDFLSQRGVAPLDSLQTLDQFDDLEVLPEGALEEVEAEIIELQDSETLEPSTLDILPAELDLNEETGIVEDAAPLPPRAPTPMLPPLTERITLEDPVAIAWYGKVDDVVTDIEVAYGDRAPAPMAELIRVVASRRQEALTHGLVAVWRDVVRHHRQTREPLKPQVSHGFRVLNDLVNQGPQA